MPEFVGKKYGGFLLSEAIKKSFQLKSNRVWVHTCSLDHKNALTNYLNRLLARARSGVGNVLYIALAPIQ